MSQHATIRPASLLWVMLTLAGLQWIACRSDVKPADKGTVPVPTRPIEAVLADHTPALMAIPGVVGVFQGQLDDGTSCIGVLVVEAKPETTAKIPAHLEGYPVKVEVSGEIRPLGK